MSFLRGCNRFYSSTASISEKKLMKFGISERYFLFCTSVCVCASPWECVFIQVVCMCVKVPVCVYCCLIYYIGQVKVCMKGKVRCMQIFLEFMAFYGSWSRDVD